MALLRAGDDARQVISQRRRDGSMVGQGTRVEREQPTVNALVGPDREDDLGRPIRHGWHAMRRYAIDRIRPTSRGDIVAGLHWP